MALDLLDLLVLVVALDESIEYIQRPSIESLFPLRYVWFRDSAQLFFRNEYSLVLDFSGARGVLHFNSNTNVIFRIRRSESDPQFRKRSTSKRTSSSIKDKHFI